MNAPELIVKAHERVAALTREYEARYARVVENGPASAYAPDHQLYDTVTTYRTTLGNHTPHPFEAKPCRVPTKAIDMWWNRLQEYTPANLSDGAILYWRMRPELSRFSGRWSVYCRLHIADEKR